MADKSLELHDKLRKIQNRDKKGGRERIKIRKEGGREEREEGEREGGNCEGESKREGGEGGN